MHGIGKPGRSVFPLLLIFLIGSSLAACDARALPPAPTHFVPPTLAAAPISQATEAITALQTAAAPVCENQLRYIEDLTIPDGTLVTQGSTLDKRWLVENSGTCNWTAGYTLQLITGPALGVESTLALYPARAGTQAALRIVYIAPLEAGIYRSAWQAFGLDGQPFGDPVFIEIVVE